MGQIRSLITLLLATVLHLFLRLPAAARPGNDATSIVVSPGSSQLLGRTPEGSGDEKLEKAADERVPMEEAVEAAEAEAARRQAEQDLAISKAVQQANERANQEAWVASRKKEMIDSEKGTGAADASLLEAKMPAMISVPTPRVLDVAQAASQPSSLEETAEEPDAPAEINAPGKSPCEEMEDLAENLEADAFEITDKTQRCMKDLAANGDKLRELYDTDDKNIEVFADSFKAQYTNLIDMTNRLKEQWKPKFKESQEDFAKTITAALENQRRILDLEWPTESYSSTPPVHATLD